MTFRRFGERTLSAGGLIAVFAIVLGARLWLIDRTGSEVPILDQWDAEGASLLKPFVDGSLRLADLFAPHNEHRLVVTRLWSLLIFVLNGQWDPYLEIVANAVLVAAMAVLFALAASRLFPERDRAYVLAGVTLWAALPYAQENTIWGFQSAFYFLVILSLLAIWGLITSKGDWRCIALGTVAGLLACFTMVSGFLCALAVIAVMLLRVGTRRATLRGVALTSSAALAVAIAGWVSRTPAVQHQAGFGAPSIATWSLLFGRCLSWPFCQWSFVGLVIYLPLVLLAVGYLKRADWCDDNKAELLLGVGGWVVLQAAAISYGRAGHEIHVVSRYMDVLALGALANFFALLILLQARANYSRLVASGAWIALVTTGAAVTSIAQVHYERGRRPYMDNAVTVARAFIATHDVQLLRGSPLAPIPYPEPGRIAALLEDPTIQRILPPAIRPPVSLDSATSGSVFKPGGLPSEIANTSRERVWGSYSAEGARAKGTFSSKPVTSRFPYFEFEIAGYLRPGLSLSVEDGKGGKLHHVIPTQALDGQWRAAYVAIPPGAHTVEAQDLRSDQWFAFREPRECARLSYFAMRFSGWGPRLLIVGVIIAVVAAESARRQMNLSVSKRTLAVVTLSLAAIAPLLLIVTLILRYGVDVPFVDEWSIAGLLIKAKAHALTWADLFAQHNEHRCFFPNLLMTVLGRVAHGNLRAEMFFSALLSCASSAVLWLIAKRTVGGSAMKRLMLLVLFNLILFSPVQAENWVWGFQFTLFLVDLLVIAAVWAATSGLHLGPKFAICAILATIATFSLGNGFIAWVITFPVAVLLERCIRRSSRLLWLGLWLAAFIVVAVLYFASYTKPAHHPPVAASRNLLDYYRYIACFLGAHLAAASREGDVTLPMLVGSGLLVLYAAVLTVAWRARDRISRERLIPWLLLGAFAVFSATMASLTRIGFGVSQAVDSRYTTFSSLISIALIGSYFPAVSSVSLRRRADARYSTVPMRVETVFLTLLAALWTYSAIAGVATIREGERTRLWGKAAVLVSALKLTNADLVYQTYLGAWAPDVLRTAQGLNQFHLLHPPLFPTAEVNRLRQGSTNGREIGYLDQLTLNGTAAEAKGWAVLPDYDRVADAVLVSYRGADTRRVLFAMNDQTAYRSDAAAKLNHLELSLCGWSVHFDRSVLPVGPQTIEAWAVDARTGLLYPLGFEAVVP